MRILRAMEKQGIIPKTIAVDSIPASFTYVQSGKGAITLPYNYYRQHHYENMMCLDLPGDGDGTGIIHVMAWNRSSLNSSIQLLINSFKEVRE